MPAAHAAKEAQNPLIFRFHRFLEAFSKADDERDFYLQKKEGFLVYVDLDKGEEELELLSKELRAHPDSYVQVPRLAYYEVKKIMEGFVNEKIYDIDTKEKLLEIIQSKESRSHFAEFLYDHLVEQEKWIQYYQERMRVRIIEWLRHHHFHFVFEEDLDLPPFLVEQLKQSIFETKTSKDLLNARKTILTKAKTYYSNEALHPKPKRGRPPKQVVKQEVEPRLTPDLYLTVPLVVRPFLFAPEASPGAHFFIFSTKNNDELDLRSPSHAGDLSHWSQQIQALRTLPPSQKNARSTETTSHFFEEEEFDEEELEDELDEELDADELEAPPKKKQPEEPSKKATPTPKAASKKAKPKRIIPQQKKKK